MSASAFHVCADSPPHWCRRGALMPTDRTVKFGSSAAGDVMRLGCAALVVVRCLFGCCGAAVALLWVAGLRRKGAPGLVRGRAGLDLVDLTCRCARLFWSPESQTSACGSLMGSMLQSCHVLFEQGGFVRRMVVGMRRHVVCCNESRCYNLCLCSTDGFSLNPASSQPSLYPLESHILHQLTLTISLIDTTTDITAQTRTI
jgi:hypothetical protein